MFEYKANIYISTPLQQGCWTLAGGSSVEEEVSDSLKCSCWWLTWPPPASSPAGPRATCCWRMQKMAGGRWGWLHIHGLRNSWLMNSLLAPCSCSPIRASHHLLLESLRLVDLIIKIWNEKKKETEKTLKCLQMRASRDTASMNNVAGDPGRSGGLARAWGEAMTTEL